MTQLQSPWAHFSPEPLMTVYILYTMPRNTILISNQDINLCDALIFLILKQELERQTSLRDWIFYMGRYNKRNLFNQLKKCKSNCPILKIRKLLLTCYPGLLDRPLHQTY